MVFSGSIPDLGVSCQGTSRAVVESFHDCLHLVVGDDGEVTVLGEVLPDEAVVIFVESAFPRTAGMGEIDVGVSHLCCHSTTGDKINHEQTTSGR